MSITTFFHDDGDEIDIRRAFEFDSLQAIMPYCPIHFSHRRTLSSASTLMLLQHSSSGKSVPFGLLGS